MQITIPEYNENTLFDLVQKISKKRSFSICLDKVSEEVVEIENSVGRFFVKKLTYNISTSEEVEGWSYIGIIEHTPEGNIVKNFSCLEIPEKFFSSEPICEHCKKKRHRGKTCILKKDNEYFQVGTSCVEDFTHQCLSFKQFRDLTYFFTSCYELSDEFEDKRKYSPYEDLDTLLFYTIELVNKFGYVKKDIDIISGKIPTAIDILSFLDVCEDRGYTVSPSAYNDAKRRIEESGFNPYREENRSLAEKIKNWIFTSEATTSYMHNLKVIFSSDMVNLRNFGYFVSSYPAYKRANPDAVSNSQFVGNIGERIVVKDIKLFQMIYTYNLQYGIYHLYKMIDCNGNVFIWRTSKSISGAKELVGRVKAHSTFNGINQTELSSCKVIC